MNKSFSLALVLLMTIIFIGCDLNKDASNATDLSEDFTFGDVEFDEFDAGYPSIDFIAGNDDSTQSIVLYFYCTDSSKTSPEPGNYSVVFWEEFENGTAKDWDVEICIDYYDGVHYYYFGSKSGNLTVSDDGSMITIKDVVFKGIIDDPDGIQETVEDRTYSGTLTLSN
jgi:hypothetical protein